MLLQGKKIFVHNILTKKKKKIIPEGNIKEKKFMLPENPPPHSVPNSPSLKWYNLSSRFLSLENSSDFKETTNQKKIKYF